jgi:hypothetical protein
LGESNEEAGEIPAEDPAAGTTLQGAGSGPEPDSSVSPLTAFAVPAAETIAQQPAVFSAVELLHPAASGESASAATAHSLIDPQAGNRSSAPTPAAVLTNTPIEDTTPEPQSFGEASGNPLEGGQTGMSSLESNIRLPVSEPVELLQAETPAEPGSLATAHSLSDPHGETGSIPNAAPALSGDHAES